MKTTEQLPDGNVNIAYTNYMGEVMLMVNEDTSTGAQWDTFYRYDEEGRVVMTAGPGAVKGFDVSSSDLLDFDENQQSSYLNDDSGLITLLSYYGTDTDIAFPGQPHGYLENAAIRNGQTGTIIPQSHEEYTSRTLGTRTIYLVSNSTVYRDEAGNDPLSTTYSYSFTSFQVASMETVDPAGGHSFVVYDVSGRPMWTKDAAGFINYIAYDPTTGAVVKTITDVNTSTATNPLTGLPYSSDYTSKPTDWTMPTNGGLHLVTQEVPDALGRPTKVTDANGHVTYTLYDDVNHEIRVYPGWDGTAHTTTGPTIVMRENYGFAHDSYIELLTTSAAPTFDGSIPTGNQTITDANLQSLSRTFFNDAGQAMRTDDYFTFSGMTYPTTTGPHPGALNDNFYETDFGYDDRGRQNRVKAGDGTIYRTVYDGLGRIISQWRGNSDATANEWSPTDHGAMVLMKQYVYDSDKLLGVGDNTHVQLIETVDHSTSAPFSPTTTRTTTYDADFRGRPTTTTLPDPDNNPYNGNTSMYVTAYDNLDRIISTIVPLGASTIDPQWARTDYDYDDADRQLTIYTPTAAPTVETYDARGLLQTLTDPDGNTTTYVYNGAGWVTTETNALNKSRTYSYDRVGNLTDRVDRDGRKIHYDYDAADRNTFEKWYPTATSATPVNTISFTYDDAGNLKTTSDTSGLYAFGASTYEYDALGRVKKEDQAIQGLTPNIEYLTKYNGANQVSQVQAKIGAPNSLVNDFENDYGVDPLTGRINSVVQQSQTVGHTIAPKSAYLFYNDADQFTEVSRYAGLTNSSQSVVNSFYQYDLTGRLSRLVHTTAAVAPSPSSGFGTSALAGYTYNYDLASQITSITSKNDGQTDYSYDASGQLTSDGSNSFSYDPNGNRNGGAIGDNNQLLSDANYSYTYDDEGNLTSRTSSTTGERDLYTWDYRNRLVNVQRWSADVEPPEGWGQTRAYGYTDEITLGAEIGNETVPHIMEGDTFQLYFGLMWTGINSNAGGNVEYWTEDVTATEGSDYLSTCTVTSHCVRHDPISIATARVGITEENLAGSLVIETFPWTFVDRFYRRGQIIV